MVPQTCRAPAPTGRRGPIRRLRDPCGRPGAGFPRAGPPAAGGCSHSGSVLPDPAGRGARKKRTRQSGKKQTHPLPRKNDGRRSDPRSCCPPAERKHRRRPAALLRKEPPGRPRSSAQRAWRGGTGPRRPRGAGNTLSKMAPFFPIIIPAHKSCSAGPAPERTGTVPNQLLTLKNSTKRGQNPAFGPQRSADRVPRGKVKKYFEIWQEKSETMPKYPCEKKKKGRGAHGSGGFTESRILNWNPSAVAFAYSLDDTERRKGAHLNE